MIAEIKCGIAREIMPRPLVVFKPANVPGLPGRPRCNTSRCKHTQPRCSVVVKMRGHTENNLLIKTSFYAVAKSRCLRGVPWSIYHHNPFTRYDKHAIGRKRCTVVFFVRSVYVKVARQSFYLKTFLGNGVAGEYRHSDIEQSKSFHVVRMKISLYSYKDVF